MRPKQMNNIASSIDSKEANRENINQSSMSISQSRNFEISIKNITNKIKEEDLAMNKAQDVEDKSFD